MYNEPARGREVNAVVQRAPWQGTNNLGVYEATNLDMVPRLGQPSTRIMGDLLQQVMNTPVNVAPEVTVVNTENGQPDNVLTGLLSRFLNNGGIMPVISPNHAIDIKGLGRVTLNSLLLLQSARAKRFAGLTNAEYTNMRALYGMTQIANPAATVNNQTGLQGIDAQYKNIYQGMENLLGSRTNTDY